MKKTTTCRGFRVYEFYDRNGEACSLQASSVATESLIWLGTDDAKPQVLVAGQGWQPIAMPEDYMATTRMHLDRKTVSRLLPKLIRFAILGRI